MLPRITRQFRRLGRSPVLADDRLDVVGGAVQGNRQECGLGGCTGDPRQRPHLGIAQLATGHRGADQRQFFQRVRNANLLACRAEIDAALPVEPMRAGSRE